VEEIKIFEFSFRSVKEWVAAGSEQDAIKVMLENHDEKDLPKGRPLSEEKMNSLKHIGIDGEERKNPKTFRERLDQYIHVDFVKFPSHFACTEI